MPLKVLIMEEIKLTKELFFGQNMNRHEKRAVMKRSVSIPKRI